METEDGSTVLEAARSVGIELESACGGQGTCGKCRVIVRGGMASEPDELERCLLSPGEMAEGVRLACRTKPEGGTLSVLVPRQSLAARQRIQLESESASFRPDPPLSVHRVRLAAEGAGASRADLDRLRAALEDSCGARLSGCEPHAAASLVRHLREGEEVDVLLRGGTLLEVGRPEQLSGTLGIAVDLGTSKIAMYLVELASARTISALGMENPQLSMGHDVISRLAAALRGEKEAGRLRGVVVEALNRGMSKLCRENGLPTRHILEICVVGNTAMHHIFLGLPVDRLAMSPFTPVLADPLELRADEVGLDAHPGARVFFPPPLAGFVGSDHLAAILASRLASRRGPALLVDLGTNTELSLKTPRGITCCSCASGPAFEGGCLRWGMRAAPGAVERVTVNEAGELKLWTVDGKGPRGLCGSGAMSALASLLGAGIVDAGGRMLVNDPRVTVEEEEPAFRIARAAGPTRNRGRWITLSQSDVRELQKAKGAVRAGVEMLLEHAGIREVAQVLLAGAFGSSLDIASALQTAMLAPVPASRIVQLGNAAGAGARELLCSVRARHRCSRLAREIDYLEPATYPRHELYFAAGMMLGEEAVQEFMSKWRKGRGREAEGHRGERRPSSEVEKGL